MAAVGHDPDEDDEALRWAGDEERGQAAPRRHPRPRSEARDRTDAEADTDGDEPLEDGPLEDGDRPPGERGRRTVALAFALPFLAEVVGWVLATARLSSGTAVLWSEILWQFGEFLAIVSPALWFVATLSLTASARPLVRAGWLALGLGVLLPWPFLLSLTGGAA